MGNNNKGNMILLTILSIATLLVAVIGSTFAYFNISMSTRDNETTIEVTNGSISIEHQENANISFTKQPAGTLVASKEFTITGNITGSSNLNYEVDLKVNGNSFENNQLVYELISTNDSNNGTIIPATNEKVTIPSGSNTIILGKGIFAGPITNGAVHKYILNIYVADEANPVDTAVFEGKITIAQASK